MKKGTSGFTIVELLIVIVVIAILAMISIVAYNGIQARAYKTTIQSDISSNAKKLEEYRILNGEYPDSQAEFHAAALKFTQGSYSRLLYCVRNTGADPNWAFVAMTAADERLYRTAKQNFQTYTGTWNTWTEVCDAVGLTTPDNAQWLRGSVGWSSWVVY